GAILSVIFIGWLVHLVAYILHIVAFFNLEPEVQELTEEETRPVQEVGSEKGTDSTSSDHGNESSSSSSENESSENN
ncbi:MAG: hypothetical protein ABEH43_09250, partial [Flavobacteriales bacterium]